MATVIANQTARVAGSGPRVMVVKGRPYDTEDPVVKANPSLFVTPDEYNRREAPAMTTEDLGNRSMSARTRRPVETATQAPGETRDGHVCDVCGETAKTKAGLGAHKRTHKQ